MATTVDNTSRKDIAVWFPNAAASPNLLSISSPRTWKYNCVAWAIGIETEWFEPSPAGVWPIAQNGISIADYVAFFAHHGFAQCADGKLVKGLDKIVLYADAKGDFLHVAKQLVSGKWSSKLGPESDVKHATPDLLVGSYYGNPVTYMSRKR